MAFSLGVQRQLDEWGEGGSFLLRTWMGVVWIHMIGIYLRIHLECAFSRTSAEAYCVGPAAAAALPISPLVRLSGRLVYR